MSDFIKALLKCEQMAQTKKCLVRQNIFYRCPYTPGLLLSGCIGGYGLLYRNKDLDYFACNKIPYEAFLPIIGIIIDGLILSSIPVII